MKRSLILLPALALLGGLACLTGCGSDTVAPHDNLPALTPDDSANQAGLVAVALFKVGPETVEFSEKTSPPYFKYFYGEDVYGGVELDYRTGGASGPHATYDTGTYVHLYTVPTYELPEMDLQGIWVPSPLGGGIEFVADIMANITRGTPDSALILGGSGGTMTAGGYSADFSITGLTVYAGDYPSGGPVTFDNGTHELEFMFDGTEDVLITLDETHSWTFDIESLELHAVP